MPVRCNTPTGYDSYGNPVWDTEEVADSFVASRPAGAEDRVNHPSHYTQGGIECIDYLRDSLGFEGFTFYCEGAAKKYLHRWRYKHVLADLQIEDLKKARWYLDELITAWETEHGKAGSGA